MILSNDAGRAQIVEKPNYRRQLPNPAPQKASEAAGVMQDRGPAPSMTAKTRDQR
ncbi:hypothetical protein RD1_1524 [Roseobacter denitrificans OCh 114]|uniref:Uncharacterized protein n=1 Tax=Roseobacter denitrificans (strain ATCC 33942 / OCh 114) TaxID=375451 RepID=Q16A36_ROSDO|nr:hypothetical protein RD1_1524 [Roseobacter denitrificans OCh 114]